MPYKEYVWPNNIAATLGEYSEKLNLGLKVNDRSHIITTMRKLKALKEIYPTKEEHNIDEMISGLKSYCISVFGTKKTKDILNSMDIPPPNDIVDELKFYSSHTPEKFGFSSHIIFNGEGIFNNISDAGWFFEALPVRQYHHFGQICKFLIITLNCQYFMTKSKAMLLNSAFDAIY